MTRVLQRVPLELSIHWRYLHQDERKLGWKYQKENHMENILRPKFAGT